MSTLEEKIAVMTAFKNGAKIRFRPALILPPTPQWLACTTPIWDWWRYEYEIVPEPERVWAVLLIEKDGERRIVDKEMQPTREKAEALASHMRANFPFHNYVVKEYVEVIKENG
jgi:hypothetical protein